jgi:hypothetical protein
MNVYTYIKDSSSNTHHRVKELESTLAEKTDQLKTVEVIMCMYIYTYTYIYMSICIFTYIYTHIYIYINLYK